MKKQIIIALFCLAMLPGCDDEPDFEENYVAENLVIGDLYSPGLVYVNFSPDSVINPQPGENRVISLDVNGDGTIDLRISSNLSDIPGGTISSSGIFGSGVTEISYEEVSDPYYYYTEIINDTVDIVYSENRSTSQPPNSNVYNNSIILPTIHDAGDTITNGVSLWRANLSLTRQYIRNDTSDNGNRYYVYDFKFGKWNGAGARYASFRFIKNREIYYGWIKMEIMDYTKIVVYEYAYRKITEI